jgi:hypothetical protein
MRFTPALLISGLLAAGVSVHSQAAFVLTLDDPASLGIDVVIADDRLPGLSTDSGLTVSHTDLVGGAGVLSYSGAVGSFVVNVTTGVSSPLIGPSRLDLNSIDVSGAAGTLIVSLTNTDFTLPVPGFKIGHGGTTDGMVSLDYLYDTANQEFGGTVIGGASHSVATEPAFAYVQTASVSSAGLYSLSIVAEITHTGAGQVTSFDAMMSPVPVPAAAWLFGSALAAFAGWRRRAV